MWYLSWTSGFFEHDSNVSGHLQELPNMTSISQQFEAREHAIIAWEQVCKDKNAIKQLYRNPQLVWKEPLVN